MSRQRRETTGTTVTVQAKNNTKDMKEISSLIDSEQNVKAFDSVQNSMRFRLFCSVYQSSNTTVPYVQKMLGVLPSSSKDSNGYFHAESKKYIKEVWRLPSAPLWKRVSSFIVYCILWVGALLGTEEFAVLIMPFMMWNIDVVLGRLVIIIWILVMTVGGLGKDYWQLPRPKLCCHSVTVLERTHTGENGFPSTHVMSFLGEFVPILYFISTSNYQLSSIEFIFATLTILLLFSTTALSRVYRGVHSVPDIIGGIVLALVTCFLLSPQAREADDWVLSDYKAFYVFPLFSIIVLLCYPVRDQFTETYCDVAAILGTGSGVIMGSYITRNIFPYLTCPFPPLLTQSEKRIGLFTSTVLRTGFIRYVFGVILMVLVKDVGKIIIAKILTKVLPKSNIDSRHRYAVQVPAKFIAYIGLGLGTIAVIPMLQDYLFPFPFQN